MKKKFKVYLSKNQQSKNNQVKNKNNKIMEMKTFRKITMEMILKNHNKHLKKHKPNLKLMQI